ncbi:lysophospholipid acyltransferase [Perkinsus chesapeaki]|uniref:Lysophospholipid acyltransferase n=1 Tax=Perkinsus chesapeaki TaxID=330153 RepID=A0A7J6MYC5_PERCH|nr:lysophospholipid acyltransferase [Perkinsus chesapeaki]
MIYASLALSFILVKAAKEEKDEGICVATGVGPTKPYPSLTQCYMWNEKACCTASQDREITEAFKRLIPPPCLHIYPVISEMFCAYCGPTAIREGPTNYVRYNETTGDVEIRLCESFLHKLWDDGELNDLDDRTHVLDECGLISCRNISDDGRPPCKEYDTIFPAAKIQHPPGTVIPEGTEDPAPIELADGHEHPHRERQAVGCVIGCVTLILLVHNMTLLLFLASSMLLLAIIPNNWIPVGMLVYSFAYLLPARAQHTVDGVSNACLLIMSLRNSMYARDVGQTFQISLNSYYDYLSYIVFFPGLLTGPVYNVKDWTQALEDTKHDLDKTEIKSRLYRAIVWAVIFLTSLRFFPMSFMLTKDFAHFPLLTRCGYIVLATYYSFGARCFAGWYVSEAGLAALGIRARNTDYWAPERANTVSQYIREWNKSVQTFFALYVYKPLRSVTPSKPVRAAIVMCSSAYWHGLEPGLYMFFMSMFVESTFLNEFPKLPSPFGNIEVTFLLSYYGMTFMYKNDVSKAFTVWANMGYVGHWYTAVRLLLLIAMRVYRKNTTANDKKDDKKRE